VSPESVPAEWPAPLIFVSFSMPEDTLRSLLLEAAVTGSPVLLRGLAENSMQRTAARLGELVGIENHGETNTGKTTPSVAIDPTLFERFGVDKVPTFVLPLSAAAPCTPEGCPVPEHLKIAGDVSLDYALGVMAREASDTPLGNHAREWRQRLEVRP
jgi:conjugal transfer pilus assembly protein TrbC